MNPVEATPRLQHLGEVDFKVTAERDIFQSDRPLSTQEKVKKVAWNLFSVIVFPVGLGRLAWYGIRKLTAFAILPALAIYNIKLNNPHLHELEMARNNFLQHHDAKQITVETGDHVKIDTLALYHDKQKNLPAHQQKWVVYFCGNAMCYEQNLEQLKKINEETGANVYTGNYRGVFRSEGFPMSSDDLVKDAEAMIQYLNAQGVQNENIVAHGWSLGGAVSTEVASLHQEKGHEMNNVNERSFSSIKDIAEVMIPGCVGKLASKVAVKAGWTFDSVENFIKIKGRKFTIHNKEDGIIKYPVSLYKKLKMATEIKPKGAIRMRIPMQRLQTQMSSFTNNEMGELPQQLAGQLHHSIGLNELPEFNTYVKQVKDILQLV